LRPSLLEEAVVEEEEVEGDEEEVPSDKRMNFFKFS
jgi:hypothetical protein